MGTVDTGRGRIGIVCPRRAWRTLSDSTSKMFSFTKIKTHAPSAKSQKKAEASRVRCGYSAGRLDDDFGVISLYSVNDTEPNPVRSFSKYNVHINSDGITRYAWADEKIEYQ